MKNSYNNIFDIFKLIFTAICVFIGMGVIVWVLSEDYPKHWAGIILIVISAYFIVKNTLALIFNKKPRLFFGGTLLFTGLVLLNPLHLHFYCYLPAFLLDYGIWHMPSVYKQTRIEHEKWWNDMQLFHTNLEKLDLTIVIKIFENNLDKFIFKNVGKPLDDDFLLFNDITNEFFKKYAYIQFEDTIFSQDYIKQSILFPDDSVFGIVFDEQCIIVGKENGSGGYYYIKKEHSSVCFTDDFPDKDDEEKNTNTIYHFLVGVILTKDDYFSNNRLQEEINKVIPQQ
jgi:hypothetical protein